MIFYQFMSSRFYFTVIACAFLGFGSVLTSVIFLNMDFSGLVGSVLFLVPINFLGIVILRSINRTRRNEYLSFIELRESNAEKEKLIQNLQATLDEVKVLRGFIPICANCKKIRDDEGYWNQIETYLEEHSQMAFSHGMCPDCADELYGKEEWFKKMKRELKS
ncbi:MAG: hypothetical protein JEZ02_20640 [Desulfatibacillum sp.]|nr:hypothetical protein [Desulfatibacillum sp.]